MKFPGFRVPLTRVIRLRGLFIEAQSGVGRVGGADVAVYHSLGLLQVRVEREGVLLQVDWVV